MPGAIAGGGTIPVTPGTITAALAAPIVVSPEAVTNVAAYRYDPVPIDPPDVGAPGDGAVGGET